VGYYELTHEARSEFAGVVLRSLLRSAEQDAAAAKRRVRKRQTEKRIRELRQALAPRSVEAEVGRDRRAWVFRTVTAAWLVSVAVVGAYVAVYGIDRGTGVVDAVMLVATLVWICVWLSAPGAGRDEPDARHATAEPVAVAESPVVDRIQSWVSAPDEPAGQPSGGGTAAPPS
jgi:hypothetical protein